MLSHTTRSRRAPLLHRIRSGAGTQHQALPVARTFEHLRLFDMEPTVESRDSARCRRPDRGASGAGYSITSGHTGGSACIGRSSSTVSRNARVVNVG